jgi:hypothetical protein
MNLKLIRFLLFDKYISYNLPKIYKSTSLIMKYITLYLNQNVKEYIIV